MKGKRERAVWAYLADVHQRREAEVRIKQVLRRHPFLSVRGAAKVALEELEREHGRRRRAQ